MMLAAIADVMRFPWRFLFRYLAIALFNLRKFLLRGIVKFRP